MIPSLSRCLHLYDAQHSVLRVGMQGDVWEMYRRCTDLLLSLSVPGESGGSFSLLGDL